MNGDIVKESVRFDFPDYMERVTAGPGGEALLLLGSGKTAVYDTGMAFCAPKMVENVERALKRRGKAGLDYVLLSHSHYDHAAGVPYLKRRWPEALVVASEKAKHVFTRPGAKKLMKQLSEYARDHFASADSRQAEIIMEPLEADIAIHERESLDLGDIVIEAFETKGHTDCSLSFEIKPHGVLLLSESTGVLSSPEYTNVPALKSYAQCLESAEKCMKRGAKALVIPHFGMLREECTEDYWKLFFRCASEVRETICAMYESGAGEEEILQSYYDFLDGKRYGANYPKAARDTNARAMIAALIREFYA